VEEEVYGQLYYLAKANRLKTLDFFTRDNSEIIDFHIDATGLNEIQLLDLLSTQPTSFKNKTFGSQYAKLNPSLIDFEVNSPFKIIDYPRTKNGFLSMLDMIKELEFSVSDEEKEIWNVFINDLFSE
jgi:hypothetical protein